MAVTTVYSLSGFTNTVTVPTYLNEQSTTSAITALAGGGFAVVAQDTDGYSDLSFYDATGVLAQTGQSFRVTQAKLTQLSNGNVVLVGIDPQGTTQYDMFSSGGQILESGTAFGRSGAATGISNVIGSGTDGFVYASVGADGTNTAIGLAFHDAPNQGIEYAVGQVAINNNPSIAQLADGNYAIAWDTTDSSGHSSLNYEVYSPATGVIKSALSFDNAGTINSQPSVTALSGGGFSIAYQDNSYSGGSGQSDITEDVFAADGTLQATSRLDNLGGNDSQPVSVTLSDGLVLTGYTNSAGTSTSAIDMVLYDPVSHTILSNGLYLSVPKSNNLSMSAMTDGEFAASYTSMVAATSSTRALVDQVVRTSQADNMGDTIVGDSLADNILGGSGNDTLTGGDGADNYLDGEGGYDTANFSGARVGYTIERSGHQTVVLRTDGSGDVLNNIEKLHFSDGDFYTPPQVRDLDGDGFSDILLQNSDGRIAVWRMNGGAVTADTVESSNPGTAWTVKGSGDFDGDGHADILLQNTATGALNIWTMNGATRTATTTLGTNAGSTWHAVTTGDFNGDGKADILLQNDSGQAAVWLMNGTTITTKSVLTNPGSTWHEIDTGDFNNDGKSDILWQNSADGSIKVWTMNGGTVLAQTAISTSPGTAWQVKSSGDFNGDGKADILMQNSSTGQIVVWTMNGTTVTSKTVLSTNPGTSWKVLGSADYNGDGKSDIALQNTSGQIAVWLMNGTTISTRSVLGNNPGAAWHVMAGTGA